MTPKTCSITGHRNISPKQYSRAHQQIQDELLRAIEEGYTHFISGFAEGTDLLFAHLVVELKTQYPITLEAAVPYPARLNTPNQTVQALLKACDMIHVHSEHYYSGCYRVRNQYMVDCSQRLLAVYDGRVSGGTAATIGYARKKQKQIVFIDI